MRTKRKRAKSWLFLSLIALVIILAGIRVYLPYWVTGYVNRQIAALDGYNGSVKDIDLHLWRGAYQIHGLKIYKKNGNVPVPFVFADLIDLSVQWAALFDGAIVAEIDLYDTDVNFTRQQTGAGANWARFVDALSPLEINRVSAHSGKIAYKNFSTSPDIDLFVKDINFEITNLRNVKDKNRPLPSPLVLTGNSIGGGNLRLDADANILKDIPNFDLNMKLENVALPAINTYSRSLAGVDFEKGNINIYMELAAKDGMVDGYVKPIARNISMVDPKTQDNNPIDLLWESLVSLFVEVFENQRLDQFATKIPLHGDLNDPDADLWATFLGIFKNAFIKAFSNDTDNTVNFRNILKNSQ